jgi:glycosyltransferase involved in cell wall biosynthesis
LRKPASPIWRRACARSFAETLMSPKVSVITVNRNMADELSSTIESVLAQTYACVEYLIVDGGSSDGSVGLIRDHADRIAWWVSERDRNLYDAMNKGVRAATGDWVVFMNSGDCFTHDNVLREVFAEDHADADLVYGHAIWHHPAEGIDTRRAGKPPAVLPLGMNCSHQSLFARRDLLLRHPFDERLLVADYDFVVWAWVEGARFKLIDRIVCRATAGGISDRRRLLSLRQRVQVLRRYRLMNAALRLRYAAMMVHQPLAGLIKPLLPIWLLKVTRARQRR